jgi:hypothetical protein
LVHRYPATVARRHVIHFPFAIIVFTQSSQGHFQEDAGAINDSQSSVKDTAHYAAQTNEPDLSGLRERMYMNHIQPSHMERERGGHTQPGRTKVEDSSRWLEASQTMTISSSQDNTGRKPAQAPLPHLRHQPRIEIGKHSINLRASLQTSASPFGETCRPPKP